MKRLMTMSVGALVLSQFLAFAAMATPKCYSTGPLEAEDSGVAVFFAKVLNNDPDHDVEAKIVAFALNGEKLIIQKEKAEAGPLSSDYVVLEGVGETAEYEVQVKLDGRGADKSLLGGFAKDENAELVAAHRLVHSEWTKIDCEVFGLGVEVEEP